MQTQNKFIMVLLIAFLAIGLMLGLRAKPEKSNGKHIEVVSEEVQIPTKCGTVSLAIVKLHTGERVVVAVGPNGSASVSTLK